MSTADDTPTLFFISFPGFSHLVPAVKTAELLSRKDRRLKITFILLNLHGHASSNISSYIKDRPSLNFIELPRQESPAARDDSKQRGGPMMMHEMIGRQKSAVRDAVVGAFHGRESKIPAGFVLDMFCTPLVDVADELGIPSYVFFTCGAATLGLCFHVQGLKDYLNEDISKFDIPGQSFAVPGYRNPFPTNVMPGMLYDKERREDFMESVRIFRRLKGILVNSFLELEEDAIKFMSEDTKTPPIYAVGPSLQDSGDETRQGFKEIMDWLDEQPDSSVVFLCFGTRGAFDDDQVKKIAGGIRRSGHRFLWSLRKQSPDGHRGFPSEYENYDEILPAGFLNGNGKVIGWAPQAAVLAHRSVGGFVSHCGWNSTLESLWFGVPVAVWPLGAEQQSNAFQLVKEFETAVEIKMDYRAGSGEKIPAEKIEAAIKELMDLNNPIRLKAKEWKEKSRTTLQDNQSSSNFLAQFADDFLAIWQK